MISTPEMTLLIPRIVPNPWRTTGPLEKSIIMQDYCGYKPVMGRGTDATCMHKHLERVGEDGILIPQRADMQDFLPAGAPLLDFLASTMDRIETWKYPPSEETYDEIIEAGVYRNSDDEYDLEAYFSGHIV